MNERDLNQVAESIVETAVEGQSGEQGQRKEEGKNPAAVALGRLGGRKGGRARADRLTAAQRSEIAKKAAHARWHKGQP